MSTSARFSIGDNIFLGHEEQARDFPRLVNAGLLGHAYLFFGDEGVGKFRFAHALANFLERGALNVEEHETLTDALFVEAKEAAQRSGASLAPSGRESSLGIDTVRAIRKFLSTTPFHSSRRTVVIRDAELLTWEAESALLKIMEEPPVHALIIMIARSPEALFPPLVSRMAKIYFSRVPRTILADFLVTEARVPAREASALAARSFGRLGYALALMKNKKRAGTKSDATLAEKLEELILEHWEKGAKREAGTLAFLLSRLEAASRFNLNARLQEKAVAHIMTV
ncbi:MAG: AAA family ATPase [Candidatus Brennerbacteria bacterium]